MAEETCYTCSGDKQVLKYVEVQGKDGVELHPTLIVCPTCSGKGTV